MQTCALAVLVDLRGTRDRRETHCTEPIFHIEWGYALLGDHHD